MTSGFTGTWEIDVSASTVWNPDSSAYEQDQIGEERIFLEDNETTQRYEVHYGSSPKIRMVYESRYDALEWVPYVVKEITNVGDRSEEDAVREFTRSIRADKGALKRSFEVGKPYGLVRLVTGDAYTHYRLGADPASGTLQYIMMRRLAEDGNSYTSFVFGVDGVISRIRRFIRVASPATKA